MVPAVVSKIGLPGLLGSMFGNSHGFTHIGATGSGGLVGAPRGFGEGLYASAVADADTAIAVRPQMRAKKVGRSVFCTVTVTVGLVIVPP
jgi:hypothetical protein